MSVILHDPCPTNPIPVQAGAPALPCPSWCTEHDIFSDSDGSTLHVHAAPVAVVAGYRVAVRQGAYVEADGSLAEPGPVEVVLNSDAVSADEARQLVAALALAARVAGGAR